MYADKYLHIASHVDKKKKNFWGSQMNPYIISWLYELSIQSIEIVNSPAIQTRGTKQ